MTIEHYTYELKKSRLGGFLGNKVAIRQDWIKRTRRYVVSQGLDLNLLATFVKKGLFDRRIEGFNQKALAEPLSKAQQWTLMWIVLSEFGVPEWLRDHEKDEHTPEMEIAEPEDEDDAVLTALLKPASIIGATGKGVGMATVATASSMTAAAGNVVGATATATADAGKAVGAAALGVAAIPVKTLSSLVGAAKTVEADAATAIAEAEEAIADAVVVADLPKATDLVEAMDTEAAPKDAEVDTSGE